MTAAIHCKYCDSPPDEWVKEIVKGQRRSMVNVSCSCGYVIGWYYIRKKRERSDEQKKKRLEHQREYMKKIREDPETYQKLLEKRRIAKAERIANMTDGEKEEYLRKAREYQRAYSQRKKMKKLINDEHGLVDEMSN